MELTPEQREQIYLEEKARIEARQQLEAQRETEVLNKNANGVERRGINMLTLIGWTAAICLLIVAFAANHNSVKELHQATEYDAIAAARGFVEDRLKSPGSAKWGDEKALSEGQSHLAV